MTSCSSFIETKIKVFGFLFMCVYEYHLYESVLGDQKSGKSFIWSYKRS